MNPISSKPGSDEGDWVYRKYRCPDATCDWVFDDHFRKSNDLIELRQRGSLDESMHVRADQHAEMLADLMKWHIRETHTTGDPLAWARDAAERRGRSSRD